jgi:hypothetical protein
MFAEKCNAGDVQLSHKRELRIPDYLAYGLTN